MTQNDYFNSPEFGEKYNYGGPLGCFCTPEGTRFSVWAPTAQSVVLNLYPCGSDDDAQDNGTARRQFPLAPGPHGVWTYETTENLEGTYYTYDITVDGVTRNTADPYAVAAGVNGRRSMVINLSHTNPEGFTDDKAPAYTNENIIYEVHVKDFTWDKASGVSDEKRGKYAGLCQAGTTLNGDGIHPTGLDYLKQLGITHIQLMPVYDYGSVDEKGPDSQFNWGYDPVNYNVPEGSYSSDPYHGEVRIKELKQLIMTLHQNGFRVIMDVVYNHTYSLDSFLNRTVPGYYYRFNEDGSPSNGSGCGNDTASERSMCAKYILDSVLYWAKEYHFDGFRFDIMGLMPVKLMNEIQEALDKEFGKGEKLIYGEPWRAADTAAVPGTILADKANLKKLHPGIGAFCDTTRDMVKGNLMQENARGLVNGGSYDAKTFPRCLRGWARINGEYSVNAPSQTIGYLSCHDDWTLWDRLINTMDEEKAYESNHAEAMRANRLAIALLIGCQGNLFILSGEESARTKEGIKNSFDSSIQVNRIDWNRIWENQELMKYYQGLFALRKKMPYLCDKSSDAARHIKRVYQPKDDCVAVELADHTTTGPWKKAIFLYNFSNKAQTIDLPEGQWQCLANGSDSFLWKKNLCQKATCTIQPMTAGIFGN